MLAALSEEALRTMQASEGFGERLPGAILGCASSLCPSATSDASRWSRLELVAVELAWDMVGICDVGRAQMPSWA